MAGHQRSSATGLALVYAALVLYASLYPFEGWRWPPGQSLSALVLLPSALHQSGFDITSNWLGYAPLGLLVALAALRSGWRLWQAGAFTVTAAAALSYVCEFVQHFVPGRVPAFEDWLINVGGACLGGVLALLAHISGLVEAWSRFRGRWFAGDAAIALVLLVLWPVGLLFPAPVPLGLGQVGEVLRETLIGWLAGVPWAAAAHDQLAQPAEPAAPLHAWPEMLIVALGLLAPCLLAYSVVSSGWRRMVMCMGALLIGVAAMSLSSWLNFGPEHAMAWLGPRSAPGLLLGAALGLLLSPLPGRLVAGVGLMVLTGLVVGVSQAPADPYFAQSLQAWEQGRFVRFHGLAQWIGWLWPFAAMLWMLSRLGARRG